MRVLLIAASLVALSGCSILSGSGAERQSFVTEQPTESAREPQGVAAPRYASSSGPVGLAPCQKKVFPARDCWRKGDQHVLYPTSVADADEAASKISRPASEKR
jgi:hypothetical protein